jgi:glycosyltransferase involved in cell wall biosynthesis
LTQWKGQSLLIEALGRIDDKRICCLLVGGGDVDRPGHRRRLTRQIEELGIGRQVRMTGECRDMPAAYMLADLVVSASIRPEAFGRVIVEAQAMGRPVIAADHGGARETVLPGKTGWLVPPGDADALRQAIHDALALSADQRDQMSQDCREHIQRNFALTGMCAATLDVYRELLPQAAASS